MLVNEASITLCVLYLKNRRWRIAWSDHAGRIEQGKQSMAEGTGKLVSTVVGSNDNPGHRTDIGLEKYAQDSYYPKWEQTNLVSYSHKPKPIDIG